MNTGQPMFPAVHALTRSHFLGAGVSCVGAAALSALLLPAASGRAAPLPHHAPRAKRVIFLHMAGGPSQLELFDYKPLLARLNGQKCPESLLAGRRFAFIKGVPDLLGPQAEFARHGESGAWISDRLPEFARV